RDVFGFRLLLAPCPAGGKWPRAAMFPAPTPTGAGSSATTPSNSERAGEPDGRPARRARESVSRLPPAARLAATTSAANAAAEDARPAPTGKLDRKSTRLNSSHVKISYAVFCVKKKKEMKYS